MKRAILTIAIVAMGLTATFAQDTTRRARMNRPKLTAEQRAERSTAVMEKKLALTADQKTKVYAIELDRAKKAEAMWTTEAKDRKAKRDEMKASMQKSKADLENVLTAEQKTKLEAFRAEGREKAGKMREGLRKGKGDKKPVVSNPPSQR